MVGAMSSWKAKTGRERIWVKQTGNWNKLRETALFGIHHSRETYQVNQQNSHTETTPNNKRQH